MTPTGYIIIAFCILIGVVLGSFFHKRFPNLFGKDRKMQKVIKDPHLLIEKLKAHGKIYDDGKELDIKIGTDKETGKEVVVIEEIKSKKARDIKKNLKKGTFVKEISKKPKIKISKSHKRKAKTQKK